MQKRSSLLTFLGATIALSVLTGCEIRQRMYDGPKFEPLEKTDLFGDNRSSRELVEGTVPRGHLNEDEHLHTGKVDGADATTFPFELTLADLERGRERYEIYCGICHGRTGHGNGMIVQRGFKQPRSYHDAALRDMPVGYYFNVASNGFGDMNGYRDQINAEDRWRIVAYIRALQRSQDASEADAPKKVKAAHGHGDHPAHAEHPSEDGKAHAEPSSDEQKDHSE